MGNCANKPLTNEEGGAPAPEEKPVDQAEVVAVEREIAVDQNKQVDDSATPRSLAQMLEDEEKKPEAEEAVKPAEEKPAEPAKEAEKPTEVTAAEPAKEAEIKKEEAPKPAAETATPVVSEPKKEETKPAEAPAAVAKPEESAAKKVEETKKPEAK